MVSESVSNDYPRVARFREAWSDWISPYEGFRIEVDEVLMLGTGSCSRSGRSP